MWITPRAFHVGVSVVTVLLAERPWLLLGSLSVVVNNPFFCSGLWNVTKSCTCCNTTLSHDYVIGQLWANAAPILRIALSYPSDYSEPKSLSHVLFLWHPQPRALSFFVQPTPYREILQIFQMYRALWGVQNVQLHSWLCDYFFTIEID